MPMLTPKQRTLTGRDDRPLMANPILFAFKLDRPVMNIATMRIRAPRGFVFSEECLSDIEWRGYMVFGEPLNTLQYTGWDPGVAILSCRGEGPDADLLVDPGSTSGLQPESLFPIRVRVQHNPVLTPDYNMWTIEY